MPSAQQRGVGISLLENNDGGKKRACCWWYDFGLPYLMHYVYVIFAPEAVPTLVSVCSM